MEVFELWQSVAHNRIDRLIQLLHIPVFLWRKAAIRHDLIVFAMQSRPCVALHVRGQANDEMKPVARQVQDVSRLQNHLGRGGLLGKKRQGLLVVFPRSSSIR